MNKFATVVFTVITLAVLAMAGITWLHLAYGGGVCPLYVAFPITPRDHFLQRFNKIKPGMTVAQADAIMKPYKKLRYTGSTYVVYHHSTSPEYNADAGTVNIRNGRITRVSFSAD